MFRELGLVREMRTEVGEELKTGRAAALGGGSTRSARRPLRKTAGVGHVSPRGEGAGGSAFGLPLAPRR
ncbi:MAG: hypothetical protein ACO2PN_08730 [Pyrobaculum sp.]